MCTYTGASSALGSNAPAAYREACDCVQADFSFFFDTGGRRRCYIAPERFYESSSSNSEQVAAQQLKPEMVGTTLTPLHPCWCGQDSVSDPMTQHLTMGVCCRTYSPWAVSLQSSFSRAKHSLTFQR